MGVRYHAHVCLCGICVVCMFPAALSQVLLGPNFLPLDVTPGLSYVSYCARVNSQSHNSALPNTARSAQRPRAAVSESAGGFNAVVVLFSVWSLFVLNIGGFLLLFIFLFLFFIVHPYYIYFFRFFFF